MARGVSSGGAGGGAAAAVWRGHDFLSTAHERPQSRGGEKREQAAGAGKPGAEADVEVVPAETTPDLDDEQGDCPKQDNTSESSQEHDRREGRQREERDGGGDDHERKAQLVAACLVDLPQKLERNLESVVPSDSSHVVPGQEARDDREYAADERKRRRFECPVAVVCWTGHEGVPFGVRPEGPFGPPGTDRRVQAGTEAVPDSGWASGSEGSSRGSHSSHRGTYQFQSPSSFIEAGSNTPRTIVASIRTAAASPTPNCLNPSKDSAPKTEKTATMTTAALVTTPAVDLIPCATASSMLAPRSKVSRIRLRMKTW